jgi:hypothetical protein
MREFLVTLMAGQARTVLAAAGGVAMAKGWLNDGQVAQLVDTLTDPVAGAATVAVVGVWSGWQKWRASKKGGAL